MRRAVPQEVLSETVYVPAATADSIYCTLFRRNPGFEELAEAELQTVAGGHSPEPGVWLSSKPVLWAETAFGMDGGRQLAAAATLDDLRDQLLALKLRAENVAIALRRIPRKVKGAREAKKVIADCIDADVDYDNADLRLLLILTHQGYRVVLPTGGGDGGWVDTSHKPHNYLVALPVRMAKAMLNLTVRPGDTVLDPFCGSGTIPLLAAWAGHTAYGSDISRESVRNARENIAHFGRHATLVTADARTTRQTADSIVSNLPYGLYSHLPEGGLEEAFANLKSLASRATFVSSERLDEPLLEAGYTISHRFSVEAARFERFIYVTKMNASLTVDLA